MLLLLMVGVVQADPKPMKILYFYDPLCGWCYGFSPVMQQFYEDHKDEADFEIISGGMITGSRIGPAKNMAPYISEAYKTVENHTGIRFGQPYLDKILWSDTTLTSIPGSVALAAARMLDSTRAFAYGKALQHALYAEGMAPTDTDGMVRIAASLGLDTTQFKTLMDSPTTLKAAEDEFALAQRMGVTGFPTVVAEVDGQYYVVCRGYTDRKSLDNSWMVLLQKAGR